MGLLRPYDEPWVISTARTLAEFLRSLGACMERVEEDGDVSDLGEAGGVQWQFNGGKVVRRRLDQIDQCRRRMEVLLEEGDVWSLACPPEQINFLELLWEDVERIPPAFSDPFDAYLLARSFDTHASWIENMSPLPEAGYMDGQIVAFRDYMDEIRRSFRGWAVEGKLREFVELLVDHGPLTHSELKSRGCSNPPHFFAELSKFPAPVPTFFDGPPNYSTTLRRFDGRDTRRTLPQQSHLSKSVSTSNGDSGEKSAK